MDIEELKKLSPEERVKRLRELEEKRKKEEEEAKKLMEESVQEIDLNLKEKKDIPIPQVKADSIESLTTEDEKQVFRSKRYLSGETGEEGTEGELEQNVSQTPIPENIQHEQYISQLAQQPAMELYQAVNDIREGFYESGEMQEAQVAELYQIQDAIARKKKDIDEGRYTTSEEVAANIDSTMRVVDEIMGKYKQ